MDSMQVVDDASQLRNVSSLDIYSFSVFFPIFLLNFKSIHNDI